VSGDWTFEERESLEVKGVGRLTTYLLAEGRGSTTQ
jgi:hypothetical protein